MDDETGGTDAALHERKELELSGRLQHIESVAKRLCTSICDEVGNLARSTEVAMKEGRQADQKKAAATAAADAAHAAAAARVKAAQEALEAEKAAMEAQNARSLPPTVKLNVGGQQFTTTRTTLCKVQICRAIVAHLRESTDQTCHPQLTQHNARPQAEPGTFLEAMFSGRHAINTDDDGSVFIDRDPTHFRMVLNCALAPLALWPLPLTATALNRR
jgi:hypothetical protein